MVDCTVCQLKIDSKSLNRHLKNVHGQDNGRDDPTLSADEDAKHSPASSDDERRQPELQHRPTPPSSVGPISAGTGHANAGINSAILPSPSLRFQPVSRPVNHTPSQTAFANATSTPSNNSSGTSLDVSTVPFSV